MFNRRKRSRSTSHRQPLSGPAAQSAQSAASHAFLKSQPSSNSLSSAAAAAALRNLTPTPTPVENVQTKRMVQRRASTQSPTNLQAGRRSVSVNGPLRRSNSSSSMTARTFREPSPHRPSTSSGPGDRRHVPVDAPPLPSLPSKFTPQNGSGRRAVSMEPSMRSPPASPRRSGVHTGGDRGQAGSPGGNRIASLGTVPETDRPGSRNSINFSYPMGSRPISPTSPVENRPMNLDVASVRESPDEGSAMQQSVSERSGNLKSRTPAVGNAEETPAAKAAGIAAGTAFAAAAALSLQKNSPRTDTSHTKAEPVGQGAPAPSLQEQRIDRSVPVEESGSGSEQPSSRPGLDRWPSTVLEENEPMEEVKTSVPTIQSTGNRFASASTAIDHREAVSTPQPSPQPSPKASRDTTPQQDAHLRQSSSPGRSARFAKWLSVTAAGDQVHEPPPRSVSPVKSALKHPRGNSLSPDRKVSIGGRIVQPPSEISDGTSVASDEGSRVGMKKRPVKVSFDDEAEIVGVAASPPTSPEEYVPESPPSKGKSRMSWLGVGKKRAPLDFMTGDDDFDEVMKPRPALPSFGSVRGNRDGGHPAPAIPDFSDNESTSSSDNDIVAPGLSFSSDHVLGGMLPKVPQRGHSQPHSVTTLEQLSVTGDPSLYQQKPAPEAKLDGIALESPTDKSASSVVNANAGLPVPAIAVEPATPPVDSDRPSFEQRSSLECRIPGGFPASGSDRNLKNTTSAPTIDLSKVQQIASAVPHLDDPDTEGESGDSVYSDAAEDIDGDGFGSINAIVDSGPIPRSPGPTSHSRDATPKAVDRVAAIDSHSQDVTNQAREDPRSITPTQDSVNREMSESPITPSSNRGFESAYPPLPLKPKPQASSPNGTIRSTVNKQDRPTSFAYRGDSDLRDPHAVSTNPGKGKPRPVSLGAAFQMKKSHGAGFPDPLRRTTSNGSDSSSSFKRASSSTRSDGPFSMRRTMRGSSTQPQLSSFSGRADSPDDRRPLSSGSGAGTMRKTLRGPTGGNERYSFFSTNNKAPRAKFTKAPPKSMRNSRFVDSDGEGDEAPAQGFRSRFADSSDEDEPGSNAMRPVRGIPRRQGIHDGDSTDLDDSSEGERQTQAAAVTAHRPNPAPPGSRDKTSPNMSGFAAVAKQRGMTQRELEEFIMQPPRGRKPGLLTRLGLKKSKNSDHRIRKADVESPSRRDTPLERSRLERDQLRGEPFTNGVNGDGGVVTTVTADPPEPTSPRKLGRRLSKRHTTGGDHWPLRTEPRTETPEPIPEQSQSLPTSPLQSNKVGPPVTNAERNGSVSVTGEAAGPIPTIQEEPEPPQAGQAGAEINDARSDITSTTAEEPGLSARDVVIAGSGRKKRFPLLRKAFGLRK
ncbi:uncharacterized protein N7496_004106 [Penicillium cataractarum]|uniref:Uncharacterized protein n=1 Tax=Penicillium cataractarum TaxID=2100454 RepID=A0A9W9SND1_9EURO|nr:uncharacterized protein N7496_004106 [Penicillium cataractarum]KAJ5381678.1 hypothetical protein N7496_004106 [Penicillium cataractarum]